MQQEELQLVKHRIELLEKMDDHLIERTERHERLIEELATISSMLASIVRSHEQQLSQ